MKTVGTLKEIGAKVGDVVECASSSLAGVRFTLDPLDLNHMQLDYRIISRAAPDYMDGEWHDWTGGEMPVPGDVRVEVELCGNTTNAEYPAEKWFWDAGQITNITRFRVIRDEPKAGPVRTVTKREIVPGQYGAVVVDDYGWITVGNMKIPEHITAAIETLTQIRDALKEQDQ